MAGGITGSAFASRWQDFLTARGYGTPGGSAVPPSPVRSYTINTAGQKLDTVMKSLQTRTHIQEARAALDANATNNIFGNAVNFQKSNGTISTNVDTGASSSSSGTDAVTSTEYSIQNNENNADVESGQDIQIAQVGESQDGAAATNNAYFVQDNTQLGNADNGSQINASSSSAVNPSNPQSYLQAWFNAVQGINSHSVYGANQYREEPVATLAQATTELDPVDEQALVGLIRNVANSAASQSRAAARALNALARLVGTGDSQTTFNRAYTRLEDALRPMDANVGDECNPQDAQVFINAVQYLVDQLPDFLMDDPSLIGEIQTALADIANSLVPGGGETSGTTDTIV